MAQSADGLLSHKPGRKGRISPRYEIRDLSAAALEQYFRAYVSEAGKRSRQAAGMGEICGYADFSTPAFPTR